MKKIKIAIIGASGYTGFELVRLLLNHPVAEIKALVAASKAGQDMAELYPALAHMKLPRMISMEEFQNTLSARSGDRASPEPRPMRESAGERGDNEIIDLAFCCLPHATSQEVILKLPENMKVIDLSADFRLRDAKTYAKWYGHAHQAEELQKHAVYGLCEHYRDQVKKARLIANPGCYPTSILLPLLPLLKAGLIEKDNIVADSKSGISGAGRSAKETNLYTETAESVHAYGIGSHRHTPEIEQELSVAAKGEVQITFTPHLMPMTRGIFSTIYVKMKSGVTVDKLRDELTKRYESEAFVTVLEKGKFPATRSVRGSNHVQIGISAERRDGYAVIVSAIDNLVKGASGQAIQNMNIIYDLPETTGLEQLALLP